MDLSSENCETRHAAFASYVYILWVSFKHAHCPTIPTTDDLLMAFSFATRSWNSLTSTASWECSLPQAWLTILEFEKKRKCGKCYLCTSRTTSIGCSALERGKRHGACGKGRSRSVACSTAQCVILTNQSLAGGSGHQFLRGTVPALHHDSEMVRHLIACVHPSIRDFFKLDSRLLKTQVDDLVSQVVGTIDLKGPASRQRAVPPAFDLCLSQCSVWPRCFSP